MHRTRALDRLTSGPGWPGWRFLVSAAVLVVAFFALGWLYAELLTVFAGALVGVFLHGIAVAVARRMRWGYRSVLTSVVVVLLVVVALAVWLVGPALVEQIGQMSARLPTSIKDLREVMRRVPLLAYATPALPPADSVVKAAAGLVKLSFEGVAGVVVALVVGIYAAFDPGAYERAFLALVAPSYRQRARAVVGAACHRLMHWMLGRAVVMLVVGVLTSVGLWIAGVPAALALGVLAGVMSFVPYLGVLVSIIPALLIALTGGPWKMLSVLVVFAIAHGLEGYVLAPIIARRTIEFPPAFTISVQVLLGALWGFLGFTFATPIAVIATILIREFYVEDGPALHEG